MLFIESGGLLCFSLEKSSLQRLLVSGVDEDAPEPTFSVLNESRWVARQAP